MRKTEEQVLLTGWLGGPVSEALAGAPDEKNVELAMQSLSEIFQVSGDFIRQQVKHWHLTNWGADKYSLGAYSYKSVDTGSAQRELLTPVMDTIYFAGEALNEKGLTGTVESAIASAKSCSEKLLAQ